MSDSVDRVFVHALNTVKKIPRTGSARPPPADRLKLYGLYKQSMEGDVEGVMDRPVGDSDVHAEKEKWDSWYAQRNVSRTEAKRRYITTLIETMHRYASPTPEAQELISELEFVWDQIKSNTSSSFSSPEQGISVSGPAHLPSHTSYDNIGSRIARQDFDDDAGRDPRLRVLSPVSQPDGGSRRPRYGSQSEREHDQSLGNREEDEDVEGEGEGEEGPVDDEDEDEEFQEARNSFYENGDPADDPRLQQPQPPARVGQRHYQRWQKRVEQALTKMTVEVAAVREQLESRKAFEQKKSGIWAWLKWLAWVALRQLCWDLALLGIMLVYIRVRDERRLGRTLKSAWLEVRQRLFNIRIFRRKT